MLLANAMRWILGLVLIVIVAGGLYWLLRPPGQVVVQTIPAGMTEQRLGHAHQAMFDDGIGLLGDIDGVYLTTLLGRAIKFLGIISLLFRLFPDKIKFMKDPVAIARKAFYGFKRAGADASESASRKRSVT